MVAFFKQVIISVLIFLCLAEAGSFFVAKYLQSKSILYLPHKDISDYEDYLERRHPVLGWIKLSDEDRLLADGSRHSPAVPDGESGRPCLSLYGDSFVWADEVDDAQAWGNLLAERLQCRVANFGVRAYGSDQAFLRYMHSTPADEGQVVILGHLSENVLRNISQDFDLLYGMTKYGLKPRYIVDAAGQIKLIPLPELSSAEFERLNRAPEKVLEHENLVPPQANFPYVASLVRAFHGYRIQAKLRGEPSYAAFYRPDHPSNALAVTTGILDAFAREARSRGDRPLVLVIPKLVDLRHFESTGSWFYAPLLDELKARKVDYVDIGPGLITALQGQDAQSIYAPASHFNERGNRLLADIVHEALVAKGLWP